MFIMKLDDHINELMNVRTKINELLEFEKQWSEVFDKVKAQTGQDESIKIKNQLVLNTFRHDKFHVMVSDFYSLLNAQIIDQKKTIIGHFQTNLTIKEPSDLRHDVSNIQLIGVYYESLPEEKILKKKEELSIKSGDTNRMYHEEHFGRIFPGIDSDFVIKSKDLNGYKDRIGRFIKRLEPFRHYFNHKYESVITKRHSTHTGLTIHEVDEIFQEYSEVINLISVVTRGSSHSFDIPHDYKQTISSSIDLILFGSIGQIFLKFGISDTDFTKNNGQNPNSPKWYYQFRNRYFDSEQILELVVKEK